jgi:hypothetical protein
MRLTIVLSIVQHLIPDSFVEYGEQLLVLGTWFYEHLYCTDGDILFIFLLTNVLIVSHFG